MADERRGADVADVCGHRAGRGLLDCHGEVGPYPDIDHLPADCSVWVAGCVRLSRL